MLGSRKTVGTSGAVSFLQKCPGVRRFIHKRLQKNNFVASSAIGELNLFLHGPRSRQ